MSKLLDPSEVMKLAALAEDAPVEEPVTEEPASDAETPQEPSAEEPAADMPEEPETQTEGKVDFHALILVEGVETGDGRIYTNVGWREPPLPFMALDTTTEAHLAARMVGNFHKFYKNGNEVWGEGHFIESTDPQVLALQSLIRSGELRGISADLDMVEGEMLIDAEEEVLLEPDAEGKVAVPLSTPKFRSTSSRLIGATAVPFPAFAESYVEAVSPEEVVTAGGHSRQITGELEAITASSYEDIDFQAPDGARKEAEKGLEWRAEYGRGGTEVGVARARDIKNGVNLSPDTVRRMASYFARHEVDKQGEGWSPGEDGFPSAGRVAWALWGGDAGQRWSNKVVEQMNARDESGSVSPLVASVAAPVLPPANWFSDPALRQPTPLTVSDEGRVYGHLALWDSCHIGFTDQCVRPPRSLANYGHFMTGEIVCEGDVRVAVGQITMDSGHAALKLAAAPARQHYDDTGWAAADVAVGEDQFGIWMAGALRPDMNAAAIRRFMAADVSGDWRKAGTNLELVAIASVNVGGFPKIRTFEQTAGMVASLVASIPVCDGSTQDEHRATQRSTAERIARTIGRSTAERKAALFNRVHGIQ